DPLRLYPPLPQLSLGRRSCLFRGPAPGVPPPAVENPVNVQEHDWRLHLYLSIRARTRSGSPVRSSRPRSLRGGRQPFLTTDADTCSSSCTTDATVWTRLFQVCNLCKTRCPAAFAPRSSPHSA